MASSNYKGVAVQIDLSMQEQADLILDSLEGAFISAMVSMKQVAVNKFVGNQYGYDIAPLQDAIVFGTIRTNDNEMSTILHALGGHDNPEAYKARFFVGGTKARFTKASKYTGLISPNDAIVQALDENILSDRIYSAINNKK